MSRLNDLYGKLRPGSPVTSEELAAMSVSADLAVHYVRAGWLTRLARGVFARPDTPLELHPSLRLLERHAKGLHVGGLLRDAPTAASSDAIRVVCRVEQKHHARDA